MSCVSETPKAEAAASVRFRLIRLLERTGHTLGLSRTMTGHLAYLIRHTREIDWQPGNRAIVYKSVTNMARDHSISERQINNRERELIEILELGLELSGNFRRYGERDADTGRIKRAFGIDLTPLKDLVPDLETALAEQEAAEERWRDRKRELSALKGRIRKLVDAAIGLGLAAVIAPLLDQRAGYQDRIRAETPIEEIERRILCARRVKDRLERTILLGKTDELPVKTSDRAEADFRHKDLPNDSLTNDKSFGRAASVDNQLACPPLPDPTWDSGNLPKTDQFPISLQPEAQSAPFRNLTTGEGNFLKQGFSSLFQVGEWPVWPWRDFLAGTGTGEITGMAAGRIYSAPGKPPRKGRKNNINDMIGECSIQRDIAPLSSGRRQSGWVKSTEEPFDFSAGGACRQ